MHGKLPEAHFGFLLFSNPGEKVWKARRTMGRFCPTVFLHLLTFPSWRKSRWWWWWWDSWSAGFLCSFLFATLWPSPRDWRPTIHCNVVLTVFHTWWYIFCMWKIIRTTFWRIVVSKSREDCSIMWENCMDTGSESTTYCIHIRTRGGIYGQIYPFQRYIWPYIPSRVLIRIVYHFNSHKAYNSLVSLIDN